MLAFAGMWLGWRHRRAQHDLPPLAPATETGRPSIAGEGRYFGSTAAGDWLDRIVARGLGSRSDCTLALADAGVVVSRPALGSFLIPDHALLGARRDRGIAGKVIPPEGMLVITWRHGDYAIDSGFRLDDGDHDRWVEAINKLVKEHSA